MQVLTLCFAELHTLQNRVQFSGAVMPQLATQQLDSIHSMLFAGHRNLRVERHSLILWGISCGGLILISNHILTAEISGDLLRADNSSALPLALNEPVEIMMNNGQSTRDWRFPGESWLRARETQWISIPWLKAELTAQTGPEIRTSLVFEPRHQPTY